MRQLRRRGDGVDVAIGASVLILMLLLMIVLLAQELKMTVVVLLLLLLMLMCLPGLLKLVLLVLLGKLEELPLLLSIESDESVVAVVVADGSAGGEELGSQDLGLMAVEQEVVLVHRPRRSGGRRCERGGLRVVRAR